ncbi:hypothetical protein, partial [Campylobacter fetus]|uniref:hypothetical protein n=1 Tax=Campylobacter fetus TaxID=196 RepID=UPI00138E3CA3
IFQKIYKTGKILPKCKTISYPGFNVIFSSGCDERSFYFKDKIDFENLQNRDKRYNASFFGFVSDPNGNNYTIGVLVREPMRPYPYYY